MAEGRLKRTRDNYPEGVGFYCSPFQPDGKGGVVLRFHRAPAMADAAEMLWIVLANVSGSDWSQQTPEWQAAAAHWRDYYFAAKTADDARRAEYWKKAVHDFAHPAPHTENQRRHTTRPPRLSAR